MKKIIMTLICLSSAFIIHSQNAELQNDNFQNIEFTLNIDSDVIVPSIAYQYYFTLGKNNNFLIGPGLRLFGLSSGDSWRFAETNAPEDNFKDGDSEVNAFIADETRIATLSLGLYLAYRINKFEIGMNTDILGFSISKAVSGEFEDKNTGELIRINDIEAETLTLFPINGSYSTEIIWAGYRITQNSLIKIGITFIDNKYEVPNEKLPDLSLPKEKFERINTTFTIGYNQRF